MDRKQSQFTEVTALNDTNYIPVFGGGSNEKISKENLFDQIKDETQIFIYPTTYQLQAANLAADPDFPIYVRNEETEYRLYKITSLAAGVNDISLNNGATATFQEEYSEIGFVVGPSPSVDNAIALFDGAMGTQLKNGPVISAIGKSFIEAEPVSDTSYIKVNIDGSITPRNTAQTQSDLGVDQKIAGPASSSADQLALFDGVTGKLIKAGQTMAQYLADFLVTLRSLFVNKIDNVAALATFTPIAGQVYYLKEYMGGTGLGGGELAGKIGSITPNNVTTFACTAGTYVERINYDIPTIDMAGADPSGVNFSTTAIQRCIDSLLSFRVPKGIYKSAALTGLDREGLTIIGDGSEHSVLQFTQAGVAVVFGTASAFRQNINVSGLTIEGNAATTDIIQAKALSRSKWNDVNAREANNTTGRGIVFQGCSLNQFSNVCCSEDRREMTNCPNEGINIEALAPFGNSSNNVFTNLYAEGTGAGVANTMAIGVRISGGTQNVFIGGSPESVRTWGLLIGANCNYNTFIGVGFENLAATGGDFDDGGNYTKFINCYSSEKAFLSGKSSVIDGGFYERIQVNSGALKNNVLNVTVNNWATGAGGYFDSGTNTKWRSIYDADLADFIYPYKDRTGLSLPASGSPYINTSGDIQQIVGAGTGITGATVTRGGITWNIPFTATNVVCILAPNDRVTLSYTVALTTFISVPFNGFES